MRDVQWLDQWDDVREVQDDLVRRGHADRPFAKIPAFGRCRNSIDGPTSSDGGTCKHADPFDRSPGLPESNPDAMAFYASLHRHDANSWGIWLSARRLDQAAMRLAASKKLQHGAVLHGLTDMVVWHELYHHLQEAALTSLERRLPEFGGKDIAVRLAPRLYRRACQLDDRELPGPPEEPLGETLANAWAIRVARQTTSIREDVREAIEDAWCNCGPGYGQWPDAVGTEDFRELETLWLRRALEATDLEDQNYGDILRVLLGPVVEVGDDGSFRPSVHGAATLDVPVYLHGTAAERRRLAASLDDGFTERWFAATWKTSGELARQLAVRVPGNGLGLFLELGQRELTPSARRDIWYRSPSEWTSAASRGGWVADVRHPALAMHVRVDGKDYVSRDHTDPPVQPGERSRFQTLRLLGLDGEAVRVALAMRPSDPARIVAAEFGIPPQGDACVRPASVAWTQFAGGPDVRELQPEQEGGT